MVYITPSKRQAKVGANANGVGANGGANKVGANKVGANGVPQTTFKHKNEFKLENSLFPELGSGIVKPVKNVINFAAAAKNEKVEIKEEIEDPLKPGWVYIRCNGRIEYKFGEEVLSGDAEFYKYENHLDLCNLNSRINRLQWDCDRENHLGDLSPYHNKATIKELLDNAYNTENYNILDRTNEDGLSNESDNAVDE
jgi:hypothetical protein